MENKNKITLHKTRLKTGDKVQVISGKNRGQTGNIIKVSRKKGVFLIEGVNIQKKHAKPNQKNQRGGIYEKPGPVHFSNVLLYSEKDKKGRRIHIEFDKAGNKKRVFSVKT